jgi:drug/metabolite transporter (DMT)-like permease
MSERRPASSPEPPRPKGHPPLFAGPSAPTPPPSGRSGCMVALMIVAGIILLLPGICALAYVVPNPKHAFNDNEAVIVFLTLLAIAAGGIALIFYAVRPRNIG